MTCIGARCVAPTFSALVLVGCIGSYGGRESLATTSLPEHVVMDMSHPWHSGPAQVVGIPVSLALGFATLPLSFGEAAITGVNPFRRANPGIVLHGAGYVGMGLGFLVGLPFFLVGLPFEESPAQPNAPADAQPRDPAPAQE
jgi:hypothetical protein